MKKGVLVPIIFSLILSICFLSADQLSSPNYQTNAIISQGAGSASSSNYNTEIAADIVTGNAASDSYKQTSILVSPAKAVTPSGGTSSSGSSGGGAPGLLIPLFSLNANFLPLELKSGQHIIQGIEITNNGQANLTINASVVGLQNFIFPNQETFTLNAGEDKMIKFNVYAFNDTSPGIYVGKISFSANGLTKDVDVALNIKQKSPLFDIQTTVSNKNAYQGGKISAKIIVKNLGDVEKIDIQLLSAIEDFNNKTYTSKIETFAIDNLSSEKNVFLDLPSNISLGNYLFYSKVIYGNITANSYDTFSVGKSGIGSFISDSFSSISRFISNAISKIPSLLNYIITPVIVLILAIVFFAVRTIVHIRQKRRVWKV